MARLPGLLFLSLVAATPLVCESARLKLDQSTAEVVENHNADVLGTSAELTAKVAWWSPASLLPASWIESLTDDSLRSGLVCCCAPGLCNGTKTVVGTKARNYPADSLYGDAYCCKPQMNTCAESQFTHMDRDKIPHCLECLEGYDPDTNCATCLHPLGRDPRACSKCLPGLGPDKEGRECSKFLPAFDRSSCKIETGCSRCTVNFDHFPRCNRCLPGFDIESACMRCLPGYIKKMHGGSNGTNGGVRKRRQSRDWQINWECVRNCPIGMSMSEDGNCTEVAPGYDPEHCKSAQLGCTRCLPNYDPMARCSRCIQGYDASTQCKQCLPGFDLEDEGCVRQCSQDEEAIGLCWTTHVIGDTHGDENYLIRSLMSTGRFTLRRNSTSLIDWKSSEEQNDSDRFEILVLGDVIDRGHYSKRNLRTLRELAESDPAGRLKLLLGNHEGIMLQHHFHPDKNDEYNTGDWVTDDRYKAHKQEHESWEVLQWLQTLPVVRMTHGLLVTHGGVSATAVQKIVASIFRLQKPGTNGPCQDSNGTMTPGRKCGMAFVDYVNSGVRDHFEDIRSEFTKASNHDPYAAEWALGGLPRMNSTGWRLEQFAPHLEPITDGTGLLWYRGYSLVELGHTHPTAKYCADAKGVAQTLGALAHVVAHTTKATITEYCTSFAKDRSHWKHWIGRPRIEGTPVIVTDTHFQDCVEHNECDYQDHRIFHNGKIDPKLQMSPQSLQVRFSSDGTWDRKRCLSYVDSNRAEVECYSIPQFVK